MKEISDIPPTRFPPAPAFADCLLTRPLISGRYHPPHPQKNINNLVFCFSSIKHEKSSSSTSSPRPPSPGGHMVSCK